ncbi:MAG: hypothetical protein P8J27_04765 [Mariniblastus sp.]|nr:hypothetical protein [Mariniblastus sp.]
MNAMPINDLLGLSELESQGILSEANIVLAIDWRAKVDFVLFGSDAYYNSSGSNSDQTLVIFRIAIFGHPDLVSACDLVEKTHGTCDLDLNLSQPVGRRAKLPVCR